MNKAALGALIAAKHNMTIGQSVKIAETVFEAIARALVAQGVFQFPGFGRITVVERAERPGRNPQTGEAVVIEAHRTIKFLPSSSLKEAVNSSKTK